MKILFQKMCAIMKMLHRMTSENFVSFVWTFVFLFFVEKWMIESKTSDYFFFIAYIWKVTGKPFDVTSHWCQCKSPSVSVTEDNTNFDYDGLLLNDRRVKIKMRWEPCRIYISDNMGCGISARKLERSPKAC